MTPQEIVEKILNNEMDTVSEENTTVKDMLSVFKDEYLIPVESFEKHVLKPLGLRLEVVEDKEFSQSCLGELSQ